MAPSVAGAADGGRVVPGSWRSLGVPGIAAMVLTVLAIALHLIHWQKGGALWRDEAGPVRVATLESWGETFQRFPHEAFPLLFAGIVRGFVAVAGDADLALRALGAAIGCALLGALWLNARLARVSAPVVSLALLAFHPVLVVFGDSLRGYGLGATFIVLAGAAYQRYLERPGPRSLAVCCLAATASVQVVLHDAALVFGLATAAALTAALDRRLRIAAGALGSGLVAALSLVPYAGPLRGARAWSVVIEARELGAREILGAAVSTLAAPSPAMPVAWLVATALAAAVAWPLGRASVAAAAGPRRDAVRFRLLGLGLCGAAQYGFFLAVRYVPSPWYFLPLMALWAASLDVLLDVPRRSRVAALAIAVGAVLLAVAQLPPTLGLARAKMTNVDELARRLAERAGPGDLVVVNPWYLGVSFHRYYSGTAPWTTLPRLGDTRFHRNDQLKERMAAAAPIDDVLAAVDATFAAGHRVWLVGNFDPPPRRQQPSRFAPAPDGGVGWANGPYCVSWSQQLAAHLLARSGQGRVVLAPAGAINPFEALSLRVFRGRAAPRRAPDNRR